MRALWAVSADIMARHSPCWNILLRVHQLSSLATELAVSVAKNYANNMRLYEATGVGALLITDHKDNLGELFQIGKEVVSYSSPAEAAELICYYTAHPREAREIARAGQARTLREHTYQRRMEELVPILEQYLVEKRKSP